MTEQKDELQEEFETKLLEALRAEKVNGSVLNVARQYLKDRRPQGLAVDEHDEVLRKMDQDLKEREERKKASAPQG